MHGNTPYTQLFSFTFPSHLLLFSLYRNKREMIQKFSIIGIEASFIPYLLPLVTFPKLPSPFTLYLFIYYSSLFPIFGWKLFKDVRNGDKTFVFTFL